MKLYDIQCTIQYVCRSTICIRQSHYIEVAEGGVSSRARHNLAYFEPKKHQKNSKSNNMYIKEILSMQLFSVDTTVSLKRFAHLNIKNHPQK